MSQVTDVLGTADSQLGSIVLGGEAPASVVPIVLSANNVFVLSQTVSRNTVLNLGVSHSLGFSQTSGRVQDVDAENTITFDDEVSFLYGKFVYGTNSLAFTQLATIERLVMRSVISTLVLGQSVARNVNRSIAITNTLNLTQTVLGTNTKKTSSTLVFSQTATAFVSKVGQNFLTLTQSMSLNTVLGRSLNSLFGVFHTVILGPNTFRRSLNSVLAFSQTVIGEVVRGIEHTITFTQSVVVHKVRGAENTFALAQNAAYNANFGRETSDFILFSHSVEVNKVTNLSAYNIWAPISSVSKTKIITQSASNNLGLSQELVRSRYFRDLAHTITFNQLVEHQRTATPSVPTSGLALTQSVGLNKVLNLSCGNTLNFKSSFSRKVDIGNQTEIIVPEVQWVLVRNLVVLRGATYAITLPAPEFDDSEAFTGSLNIVRFKTGGRKVYKQDTDKRVLDYTFKIGSYKKDELKYFIDQYNSTPFYLENWKGEIWYVVFNSNPFAFVEEAYWETNPVTGSNKFSINLTFQGVRLN